MAKDSTYEARIERLEQALDNERRESRHVRALMESARDFVIYRLEKDSRYPFGSRVVFVSPSIKSLMGVDDPYDFSSWFDRIHPDDRPEVVREELDAAPARRQFHKVMRVIAPDAADARWVQATSTPVVNERGEVTHYDGLIFDVTVLKRAKQVERAAKGRLEEVVAERTVELVAAQEKLMENERLVMLGSLAATAAHELRNPLGTISNATASIAKHVGGDARLDQPVELIRRNVDRCVRILDALLEFGRPLHVSPAPVAVSGWLAAAVADIETTPPVAIELDTGESAVVDMDAARMRQALRLLIDNALDAIDETPDPGCGRIYVRGRTTATAYEIEVEDSGAGIPQDVRERVFEPLFSTKAFGLGLGLPLVQKIVSQHDGSVELTTARGRGTKVVLSIPLGRSDRRE